MPASWLNSSRSHQIYLFDVMKQPSRRADIRFPAKTSSGGSGEVWKNFTTIYRDLADAWMVYDNARVPRLIDLGP